MKPKSTLFFLILTTATMFFILSASIAVPLLARPFYYAHAALLHLPAKTGWSMAQIQNAYNEMLNFCLFGTPFGTGDLRWSESGMSHFADCARLFHLDFMVLAATAAILLISALLYRRGLAPARPMGRGFRFWAGSILAAAFLAISLLAALNFDRAFVVFHRLFFPGKDNWLFDPATDQIILILPQVFFQNCAILIVLLLLSACLILILTDHKKRR